VYRFKIVLKPYIKLKQELYNKCAWNDDFVYCELASSLKVVVVVVVAAVVE